MKTQEPSTTAASNQEQTFSISMPNEPSGAGLHVMGSSLHNSINSMSPVEGQQVTELPTSFTPEGVDATSSFGWDMISLGLEEPFPAREVIEELYVLSPHFFMPTILMFSPGTKSISRRAMPLCQ